MKAISSAPEDEVKVKVVLFPYSLLQSVQTPVRIEYAEDINIMTLRVFLLQTMAVGSSFLGI